MSDQTEFLPSPHVADVTDADVYASISAFARAFGVHYETLRRCLLDHGAQPVGRRHGHSMYGLRDVYAALKADSAASVDPDKLPPVSRRAWFQSELDRVKLARECGELVPAIEVQDVLGKQNQLFVRGLETLTDRLEREVGLNAQQAAAIDREIKRLRLALYKALTGEDEDAEPEEPPEEPAVAFLRELLAAGPVPAADVREKGARADIAEAALKRAKATLGVRSRRAGKGWVWELMT